MDEINFIMKKTAKPPCSTRGNKKQIDSIEAPQESYSLWNRQYHLRPGRIERQAKVKLHFPTGTGQRKKILLSERKTTLK